MGGAKKKRGRGPKKGRVIRETGKQGQQWACAWGICDPKKSD